MDLEHLTSQLEQNAEAIRILACNVSDHQARWKPEEDAWSILDVINHLADETEPTFRDRLDLVLHRPQESWDADDGSSEPVSDTNQPGLGESLEAFLAGREESLAWLKALESPDWDMDCQAPFGRIRAGDIIAAWVAHDLLHVRQLVELHRAYLIRAVEPYGVAYAED